jgi:putative heme-binding domain-containing protein
VKFSAIKLIVVTIMVVFARDRVVAQQTLESKLKQQTYAQLATKANLTGDPRRGAIVFYQAESTCTKCHLTENERDRLGPDLATIRDDVNPEYLVQSMLDPSHTIREGFQTVALQLLDGRTMSGLLVEKTDAALTIRRVEDDAPIKIDMDDIDDWVQTKKSTMPDALVNILKSDQEFFDLASYLIEISEGGADRAAALQPPRALYEAQPIPEYENNLDHAGLIRALGQRNFERGKDLYNRQCINCHGTVDQQGSLPTSLRFAHDQFKNGSDPYAMYKTITYGYGMMVRQHWMVPQQKYDVIHYIREAYLKPHNQTQYTEINNDYLASLPSGNSRGPAPANQTPWTRMDYGPHLNMTLEQGNDGNNIAYKGIAVRLNSGPGGVTQGTHWMLYEHDTMRVAAAWSGDQFMDFNGINFNDLHNVHPRTVGDVHFANPTAPGWADPDSGSFNDPRLTGRDKKHYGPMPSNWLKYNGIYQYGTRSVISYSVGNTPVLELPGMQQIDNHPVWTRSINLGPTEDPLTMQIAKVDSAASVRPLDKNHAATVIFNEPATGDAMSQQEFVPEFGGQSHLVIEPENKIELTDASYTIVARIKTKNNGTIFSQSPRNGDWSHNGKTLFIRNGRLCFDIGWVGVVTGKRKINDGRWHCVAASWDRETARLNLYVDGKLDQSGTLAPKANVDDHVLRIGYTAPNFPNPSGFTGKIQSVSFFASLLDDQQIANLNDNLNFQDADAHWNIESMTEKTTSSSGNLKIAATWIGDSASNRSQPLIAHVSGLADRCQWTTDAKGNLRLKLPPSPTPRQFTIAICRHDNLATIDRTAETIASEIHAFDLSLLTTGGPRLWETEIHSKIIQDLGQGPFAVDVFVRPEKNPWDCRIRLTGVDFVDKGDTALLCSWDGSVWRVTGLLSENDNVRWQRIAHGMFQPLGIKVIDDQVYVGCRDQIVKLHDLNGDYETDYYECFNSDHQVTEHFHEFAMGLQADNDGNLYYAKSARHALPAIVPHHGTLLKVSKDGSKTEILANGFRAANGVCLNDDGSFIVTDQEGHWNPKNRINWVKPGGFYGNMFGYHDVTDSSDAAMDPPLCWITNAFDRSPAELLWVRSEKWGPLNNSLLNFSYGYGKIYVVPHENVGGQMQGGMCEFPLPRFPTGIMRGRFNDRDGQLYSCGMYAWGGDQTRPGGFYRIRYTGQEVHLPIALSAATGKLTIGFSGKLDEQSVKDINRYKINIWSLKRTANYGSNHYDQRELAVSAARLLDDGTSIELTIPELQPTWCMEIKYALQSEQGHRFTGTIHNTIHKLVDSSKP